MCIASIGMTVFGEILDRTIDAIAQDGANINDLNLINSLLTLKCYEQFLVIYTVDIMLGNLAKVTNYRN